MPCPHNEISIVQRSQRQSAVAAAAYQSGEKLFCEYDQQVKHYQEKRGIVHNGDTKRRTERLDEGWTKPGDFQGLKDSQRSIVLSPAKGAFHRRGFGSISGIFREISRRLPQSDEAKGSPQQSD